MDIHNWDDIIAAHSAWKQKFGNAIAQKETMDAHKISSDSVCSMGQWLHGEGRTKYSHLGNYLKVLDTHSKFHEEAGNVAAAINAGRYAEASAMIEVGTPYTRATQSCVSAILALKRELKS